jgi:hypothetical protein
LASVGIYTAGAGSDPPTRNSSRGNATDIHSPAFSVASRRKPEELGAGLAHRRTQRLRRVVFGRRGDGPPMCIEGRQHEVDAARRLCANRERGELRRDDAEVGARPLEKDEAIVRHLGEHRPSRLRSVPDAALVFPAEA